MRGATAGHVSAAREFLLEETHAYNARETAATSELAPAKLCNGVSSARALFGCSWFVARL